MSVNGNNTNTMDNKTETKYFIRCESVDIPEDPLQDIHIKIENPEQNFPDMPVKTEDCDSNESQDERLLFAELPSNEAIKPEPTEKHRRPSRRKKRKYRSLRSFMVKKPTLIEAVAFNKLPQVRKVVKGSDINKRELCGNTPLILAVKLGHTNIVQYLVEKGAVIDVECISQAIEKHQLKCLECLLKNKQSVDLNQVDENGFTPLTKTIACGNEAAATLLLANGADPNVQDSHGDTPLRKCLRERNYTLFHMFAQNGADINETSDKDIPLLSRAATLQDFTITTYLINSGASIERSNCELNHFKNTSDVFARFVRNVFS